MEEEKEKDECSIVRLEYPPRRNCRDGRAGWWGGGGRGREGDSDPSQKRHSKESTRGGPGGHGRDTFVRLSPNSIGDE